MGRPWFLSPLCFSSLPCRNGFILVSLLFVFLLPPALFLSLLLCILRLSRSSKTPSLFFSTASLHRLAFVLRVPLRLCFLPCSPENLSSFFSPCCSSLPFPRPLHCAAQKSSPPSSLQRASAHHTSHGGEDARQLRPLSPSGMSPPVLSFRSILLFLSRFLVSTFLRMHLPQLVISCVLSAVRRRRREPRQRIHSLLPLLSSLLLLSKTGEPPATAWSLEIAAVRPSACSSTLRFSSRSRFYPHSVSFFSFLPSCEFQSPSVSSFAPRASCHGSFGPPSSSRLLPGARQERSLFASAFSPSYSSTPEKATRLFSGLPLFHAAFSSFFREPLLSSLHRAHAASCPLTFWLLPLSRLSYVGSSFSPSFVSPPRLSLSPLPRPSLPPSLLPSSLSRSFLPLSFSASPHSLSLSPLSSGCLSALAPPSGVGPSSLLSDASPTPSALFSELLGSASSLGSQPPEDAERRDQLETRRLPLHHMKGTGREHSPQPRRPRYTGGPHHAERVPEAFPSHRFPPQLSPPSPLPPPSPPRSPPLSPGSTTPRAHSRFCGRAPAFRNGQTRREIPSGASALESTSVAPFCHHQAETEVRDPLSARSLEDSPRHPRLCRLQHLSRALRCPERPGESPAETSAPRQGSPLSAFHLRPTHGQQAASRRQLPAGPSSGSVLADREQRGAARRRPEPGDGGASFRPETEGIPWSPRKPRGALRDRPTDAALGILEKEKRANEKRTNQAVSPDTRLEIGAVYEAVVTNVASGQRAFLRLVRRVSPVSEETGAAAKDDGGAEGVGTAPARSLNVAVTVHISRISRSMRVGGETRTRSPAIGEILSLGASVLVTPLPVGSESPFAATHVSEGGLTPPASFRGQRNLKEPGTDLLDTTLWRACRTRKRIS
ncbi:elongation factor Tu GTP binding domain-containing protein [Toxoplasma gondii p89]|uniref:Elongation factor Tu GTP binding domain-containing protein n=1 Tax=Toxoplasma gondii p89 TaxID=943119 RepID=A0A086KCX4_TOXGO|nr:elongation factor Tu GTP binding domain-containing protein [Toxoplasma gondii p89]